MKELRLTGLLFPTPLLKNRPIPLLWPRLSHSTPDINCAEVVLSWLDYMHENSVQSDCCVLVQLRPTRKDTIANYW